MLKLRCCCRLTRPRPCCSHNSMTSQLTWTKSGRHWTSPLQPFRALSLMELKGLVRQVGGINYVRARETGPAYRVD